MYFIHIQLNAVCMYSAYTVKYSMYVQWIIYVRIYIYTHHYIFTLMTHFQATPKQSSEDPEMICSQARQYEQHLPEWTQEFAKKLRSVEFGSPDEF